MWKFAALVAIAVTGVIVFNSGGSSVASREAGGGGAGLPGIYPSDINISDDPAGHHPFVGMPESLDLNVAIDGLEISITGAAPWVGVSGTIKGGEFFATGAGTVAGYQDIAVDFQGTLTSDALAGLYTMGAGGGLPGGLSIIYEIKPPKLYAITVLKRNDETKEGLAGWEINLYAGGTCSGNAIDSGTTDADGLVELSGLRAGSYSVEEKMQAGWNNVSPLCQAATVPGAAGSGAGTLPTCPVSPDLPFPDPGCDEFSSVATVQVVFTNPPIDPLECDLSGPTQITRGAVVSKPPDSIDTEIVAMELTGQCEPGGIAVAVRVSPTRASTGRIVEQADDIAGTLEFKADSFFDVFFEIDTPLGTLHNQDALRINCKIQGIPPFGCLYEPDVGVIPLFDDTEKEVGTLLHAAHIPIDPNKVLVIFSNAPKPTGTVTPTPTGPTATATQTPITTPTATPTLPPGEPTATPTRTPITTPTGPTPTPAAADGDVNCDETTNSIDAALVLQLDAALIASLDCEDAADVNGDGATNSVDAAIILQYAAGLIDSLPV